MIYTRFSCHMNSDTSCVQQERKVRAGLDRMQIDHSRALVLNDEAISGFREDRPGLEKIKTMIAEKSIAILAVDDQSRLSRGCNVQALITDLAFSGGRFISVGENIDTARDGWEVLVGIMGIHHQTSNKELGRRVRRGQEERILSENGSVGDHPFGYRSVFVEENWAQLLAEKKRARKVIEIHEPEAEIVRMVFRLYAIEKMSACKIAQKLNEMGVQRNKRSWRGKWGYYHVMSMMKNEKYIGIWHWGRSKVVRDSTGRWEQRVAEKERHLTVKRESLRIVDQDLWDRAQEQRRANREKLGMKPARKWRGDPPNNPRRTFPGDNLSGLIACGECGHKLYLGRRGDGESFLMCPQHYPAGQCTWGRQPLTRHVSDALAKVLQGVCSRWPAWFAAVKESLIRSLGERQRKLPNERLEVEGKLAELTKKIKNLVDVISNGSSESQVLAAKLVELENEAESLRTQEKALACAPATVELPDDEWISKNLKQLPLLVREYSPAMADLLRRIFPDVTTCTTHKPFRKVPYVQLNGRLNMTELAGVILGDGWRDQVSQVLSPIDGARWEEFRVDVTPPTKLERLAPKVEAMRADGVTWREIQDTLGIHNSLAIKALRMLREYRKVS